MYSTSEYDVSRGYRYYEVQDHEKSRALGGLCLPLPAGTSCRLILSGGAANLKLETYSAYGGGIAGDAVRDKVAGVYTTELSGCQAVGIFTYEGGRWTSFFFQHCLAGFFSASKAKQAIGNGNSSFAVVVQRGFAGMDDLVDATHRAVGVPKYQITAYAASTEISPVAFGVRFNGGLFGEL
jgi:hypothetical protein